MEQPAYQEDGYEEGSEQEDAEGENDQMAHENYDGEQAEYPIQY